MKEFIKKMITNRKSGQDFHRLRAAKMFNIPEEKVTPIQRHTAKIQNWKELVESYTEEELKKLKEDSEND
jgi:DNA polymerase I-like protein with 3'-5' exonuclease and polymerase domains